LLPPPPPPQAGSQIITASRANRISARRRDRLLAGSTSPMTPGSTIA
jgi:hypothetical protein